MISSSCDNLKRLNLLKLTTTSSKDLLLNQRDDQDNHHHNQLLSSTSASNSITTFSSDDHSALPTHHLPNRNGFRNPWPSACSNNSLQLINNGIPIQWAKKLITPLKPIRTLPADLKLYDNGLKQYHHQQHSYKLISTWLGHAGYLVQFPMYTKSTPNQTKSRPFRVLFDPMFSIRAGPTQWTGPKRLKPSPCHIKQIPIVDVCMISHSHYDHLDFDTIQELSKRQPHLKYFVPLGLKSWFESVSVSSDQVVELDWWQSCTPHLSTPNSQRALNGGHVLPNHPDSSSIRITCVPAQHSSGRSLLDQNSTLWCGWIVEQTWSAYNVESPTSGLSSPHAPKPPSRRTSPQPPVKSDLNSPETLPRQDRRCCVYFAGDTGYRSPHDRDLTCPAFKEIGKRFGPIDFSMIPIWRGGSLSFVSWAGLRISDPSFLVAHHATPEDALRIHLDVRSEHSIGIHHSCFVGSEQESVECLMELEKFKAVYKVPDFLDRNGFGVVDVGETIDLEIPL